MKTTVYKRICPLICLILAMALFLPCAEAEEASSFPYPYGVFLGINDNLAQFRDYETVVIDAQYFSGEEIDNFRNEGHQVYTFIAMTADAFSENVTECLNAGMNGHIAKPIDIKLVIKEIRRIKEDERQ